MKRILITGITGYIGSHLARALLPDYEVYGLVREPLRTEYIEDIAPQIHFVKYDGSYESMGAALHTSQPDVVYHLAAYYTGAHGAEDTPKLINSNITLGVYLLEAMCACDCSVLVYVATVMAHYQGAAYRPLNLYAATKQAFSDLVEYYTGTGKLSASAVMLSDTYGPDDRRPKVLNLIHQAILEDMPLDLTSGRQIFDVVYIDDVIYGFLQAAVAAEHEAGHHLFQLASPGPRSLRDTVDLMLEINGLRFRANWGGRADPELMARHPVRLYPAPPGWEPQFSLEEGLRRFWAGL